MWKTRWMEMSFSTSNAEEHQILMAGGPRKAANPTNCLWKTVKCEMYWMEWSGRISIMVGKWLSMNGDSTTRFSQLQWKPAQLICWSFESLKEEELSLCVANKSCTVFLGRMLKANTSTNNEVPKLLMMDLVANWFLLQRCKLKFLTGGIKGSAAFLLLIRCHCLGDGWRQNSLRGIHQILIAGFR